MTMHHGTAWRVAGSQQTTKMIGKKCPGAAGEGGLMQDGLQPIEEIVPVPIIFIKRLTLYFLRMM
jgi:hypothetical protein